MTEAQKAVIGCIAYRGDITDCIRAGVEADWFDGPYRAAFECAAGRFADGKHIDSLVLAAGLTGIERPVLFIDACIDAAVVPSNIVGYIDMIRGEYLKKKAGQMTAEDARTILHTEPEEMDRTIAAIEDRWAHIIRHKREETSLLQAADDWLEKWKTKPEEIEGLRWPLYKMNELMSPITDEYIFIAARESVGKTAIALQLCLNNSAYGHRTSYASLESSTSRICTRVLAHVGKVNTLPLRKYRAEPGEYEKAVEARKKLETIPFVITDRGMTIEEVYAWGKMEKSKGSKLLVIDNMKHIRQSRKYNNVTEQFRDYSTRLKWIRDDLRIPLIVLHHLNKELDVSWSDDIRRDADIIIAMTEDEELSIKPTQANGFTGKSIVDWDVQKDRDGERGFSISMEFQKQTQTFVQEHDGGEWDGSE